MRKILWAISIMVIVVGVYLIGGGLVAVDQVRAEESRLQRAIAQATLPDFHLVERTPALTTRHIWKAWLVGHVPVMNDFLVWEPGQHLLMSATYRTDATPTMVSTQYAARFHSPVLSTQASGVHITVFIRSGPVPPNRQLDPGPYPVPRSYPTPTGTAQITRAALGAGTRPAGDPISTHGTLVDISASIPEPARPAYPMP